MKKLIIIPALIIGLVSLFSFKGNKEKENVVVADEKDYLECFKKYGSAWGETCPDCKTYKDSYKVKLRNECNEKIDVMVCVQEANKTWKRFQWNDVKPKDSVIAYACESNGGKYLKWARKAGDKSTTFLTVDEVNAKYKD